MAAPIIFNGEPGTIWSNDTGKARYQFVCALVNTCGACLQYHMAIGPWWPIPIHRRCRCKQIPIFPGANAPHAFVDFRSILDNMSHADRVTAVGASNYALLRSNVVSWAEVVTKYRVRSLREVIALNKVSRKTAVAAGVRPGVITRTFGVVHGPEQTMVREERAKLTAAIAKAGVSQDQLVEHISRALTDRVVVKGGAGTIAMTSVRSGPSTADRLTAMLATIYVRPPAPAGPPPTPKDKREIDAAIAEQRAHNAAEATATPVVTITRGDDTTKGYIKAIKASEDRIAEIERIRDAERPAFDKLNADMTKWYDKSIDYSLSKATRAKYDKLYRDNSQALSELRTKVVYAPQQIKAEEQIRDYYIQQRDASIKPVAIDYGVNQAAHPNLIAPGPIDERLKKYTAGDVKVDQIGWLGDRLAKVETRLATQRGAIRKSIDDLMARQGEIIEEATLAGRPISAADMEAVDKLQVEIDALVIRRDAIRESQKRLEQSGADRIAKIIEADNPIAFRAIHPDAGAVGADRGAATLTPPTAPTQANIDRGMQWLSKVVERGDGQFATSMNLKVGEAPNVRAHFVATDPSKPYHIQVATGESTGVVVHEVGHAIDKSVVVGAESVVKRSLEFKEYRLKGQAEIELNTKFSGFDPGERGADDDFGKSMNDRHAYYTGKDYGAGATEIVSMGLQALYERGAQFAKKDPEFCKFILGVLDGSLR